MVFRATFSVAVVSAVIALHGGGLVDGFTVWKSKEMTSKQHPSSLYYSYKTFKKLGIPAILYSAVTKVATKVLGIKPKVVLPFAGYNSTLVSTSKVAVVTGSNTGVGFETAKALAVDHGFQVIIACRSAEKAKQACDNIIKAVEKSSGYGKAIFVLPLDLSNLDSVREFGRAIKEEFPMIDVLVNNAGKNSAGGVTLQLDNMTILDDLFTTNFLGHFLLT
ncbi:short chain dehydrogenase [Nitzschia inconspicua]|uniref:Short chain dehydrogenase n=1 Tax=Nitzschia inconspicua TaxID=303405 RepID=A0A9K3LN12_9STRA|nr:short chain dehydrogenase [Nitzschia inconspicua]